MLKGYFQKVGRKYYAFLANKETVRAMSTDGMLAAGFNQSGILHVGRIFLRREQAQQFLASKPFPYGGELEGVRRKYDLGDYAGAFRRPALMAS